MEMEFLLLYLLATTFYVMHALEEGFVLLLAVTKDLFSND